MEENNENKKEFTVDIDKEEIKNQTKETVNQTKETIKNINFKKDANATKGFVLEMISKPYSTIQNVVTEKENYFSNAIILAICFMIVNFAEYLVGTWVYKYTKFEFMTGVLAIISPILNILAFTVATVLFGGKEKKSINTIISAITIAKVPIIISGVLSVARIILDSWLKITFAGYIISVLISALSFVSIVLMFFAIKGTITQDEDDKMFRKIAIIILVGYAILKVAGLMKLYSIV